MGATKMDVIEYIEGIESDNRSLRCQVGVLRDRCESRVWEAARAALFDAVLSPIHDLEVKRAEGYGEWLKSVVRVPSSLSFDEVCDEFSNELQDTYERDLKAVGE